MMINYCPFQKRRRTIIFEYVYTSLIFIDVHRRYVEIENKKKKEMQCRRAKRSLDKCIWYIYIDHRRIFCDCYRMEILDEMTTQKFKEYRHFCFRIGIACFLVIITWIWKNNEWG